MRHSVDVHLNIRPLVLGKIERRLYNQLRTIHDFTTTVSDTHPVKSGSTYVKESNPEGLVVV